MKPCIFKTIKYLPLVLVMLLAAGCGGNENAAVPDKTLEDHKKEAQKEITTENAEAELEALEKELEAES